MKLEKAIQRCFDKCNLIGENCDVITVMYQYKAIRELQKEQFDAIYDELVERLGFTL